MRLAEAVGVPIKELQAHIDRLFDDGATDLAAVASSTKLDNTLLASEDDFAQTIHSMGTNLLFWVQDIHTRGLFSPDARVLGLTSEGSEVAWRCYGVIAAAKAALEAVARSIAVEFAPYGIRCNILQPGVTDTPALPSHSR